MQKLKFLIILLFGSIALNAQIPSEHLHLWYSADSVIVNSGKVSQLYDLSGNANHAVQISEVNKPSQISNTLNGNSVLRFNGSQWLKCQFPTTVPQPVTIFAVWRVSTAGSQACYCNYSTTIFDLQYYSPSVYIYAGSSIGYTKPSTFDFVLNTSVYNLGNSNLYENSFLKASGNPGSSTMNGITVGALYNNTWGLYGDIAEIIMYDTVLSDIDRIAVENYLMDKYSAGLNLGDDICNQTKVLTIDNSFTEVLWSTGETTHSITVSNAGQYFVQARDNFGRMRYDTLNASFINFDITDKVFCSGDSVVIKPNIVETYNYLWSTSASSDSIYISEPGLYSLTLSDDFSCSFTDNFVISVDSFPSESLLISDTSMCAGNYLSVNEIFSAEIVDFNWMPGNQTEPELYVYESGLYTLSTINTNGCINVDSINTIINGTAPTPDFSAQGLCFGSGTEFTDLSYPQDSIANHTWIFNDQDTLYAPNPSFIFPNTGLQSIQLIIESFTHCISDTTISIDILALPNVTFNHNPICSNTYVQFIPEILIPPLTAINSVSWFIDDELVSNADTLNYLFESADQYDVQLLIELDNSCTNYFEETIFAQNDYPMPGNIVLLSPSEIIYSNDISFNWSHSDNVLFYNLTISNNLDFTDIVVSIDSIYQNSYDIILPEIFDTLFWRVVAINPCLETKESPISHFYYFSPELIPGIKLWYAADSCEIIDSKIATLYDLSGNGFDAIQANLNNRPLKISNLLNEHSVIKFEGNQWLKADFLESTNQPVTAFVIWNKIANGDYSMCFSNYSTSHFSLYLNQLNNHITLSSIQAIPPSSYLKSLNFSYLLNSCVFNTANSQLYENGALMVTENSGSNQWNGITLGARYDNNYFLNGNIAEVIFYDTLLTQNQRQNVENYLMDKYAPKLDIGDDILVNYGFCDTLIDIDSTYFSDILWSTGDTTYFTLADKTDRYFVQARDLFGRMQYDTIKVQFPLVADFADTVVCFGNSVLWDAELVGDYSFAWYGSSETTRAITIDAEGDYAVIVNDTLGCQYLSDTISFSFDNYEFTASVGPVDTSLCAGNRLMLVTNRPETVSYLWNTGSTSPEIVLASSGTYSVTTTNWRGCEANDEIDVTITGTVPVPLFSSEGHCAQNPVYFTDLSTSSDGTINSWTWSINGEIFSTEQNPVLSPGDIPDVTAIIPAGEITTNLLRKLNDTARLYRVVPTVNGRETESSGNIPSPPQHNETESSGNIPSPQHNETESNQTKSPTNYQVQLTISTDAGCSDFLTSQLTIYPLPVISFTPDYFCQWAPVDFISTAQVYGGTISENIWDFNGTQQIGENITHTFTQSGNNPITLISTSDVGCRDSLVTEVYVKNASLPVFSTENACEGSEIYFVNNTEVLAHNLPLEWNWDFGDGNTGSGSDPAHIYESAGVYDVSINVVWQNMCEVPAIAQVEVYHNPSLSLLAEDQCINVPFHITKTEESLSGEIISHYWVFGSENPIVSTHPTPQFNSSVPGEYPVSLNIETEFGCVANAVDTVIVHGNPHASFTPSRVWGAVPMEVEFTNNSSDAIGYMWRLDEISVSFDENPVHVYTTEGEFEVKMYAYSQFACEDDTVIIIKSVIPILDVILYDLRTVMSGNYLQTNVYLINNGTLPVNNAEITLDLGDGKIFRENIEYLAPSQVLDYKFNMEVYRADGKVPEVVCTEIYAPPFEGYAETTTDDNVLCSTDVETLRVYQPYPNPATGELNVSFILESESDVTITLISGIGEQVYKNSMSDKTGYQKHIINVGDYTPGVYYLQITAGDEVRSFKVEVL